jgi:branched-chain amino acid transport system permease protein
MNQNLKTGLVFGFLGGLMTFIFGGWSVAVIGVLMGIGLGLALSPRLPHQAPLELARLVLPVAAVSAGMLLVSSLLQNYIVDPAIGKFYSGLEIVIPANLAGVLGGLFMVLVMAALHGLTPRQEQIGKLILIAVVVVAFPFVDSFTGLRWIAQVIFALIFVILGMGLNIVVGYAGLLDLGYAAFFAIGAYTTGILSSTGSVLYFSNHILLNFWLVIWIAAAMAAVFGLLLGAPTLPLRGDYLAIVTLGFGEIIPVVFRNLIDVSINEPLTCWIIPGIQRLFGAESTVKCIALTSHLDLTAGEKGINPISPPSLPIIGAFSSARPITWYFLIIAIILLSIFLINRLHNSRLGRAWKAIREDQLAAEQMGIDPVRTKLLAFAMGATFSGFAGAFYASYIAGIFPGVFDFSASILILCTVILGGIGNIYGVLVGGLVLLTADRLFLPALKDFLGGLLNHTILPALAGNPTLQAAVSMNANPVLYRYLLFGLTLVIMMAVRPEGLVPNPQRRMELHEAEFEEGGPEAKPGGDVMDEPAKATPETSLGHVE